MGEESPFHPDNRAREDARWELEQDITIPDHTELVEATVGQRMSIAAETMIMAHLSTCIVLSHARLKAEQRSVAESSLPKEIRKAGDYVNRARDQIEMLQYVRGRIGEDRDTVLDMGRTHGHGAGVSAPVQGETSDPDSPPYSPVSEDDEPGKPAPKRWSPVEPGKPAPKRSSEDSPVASGDDEGFSPATPTTSDDERPRSKRPKQHGNATTVTGRGSFSILTPERKVN
jgi:hypothetical protein